MNDLVHIKVKRQRNNKVTVEFSSKVEEIPGILPKVTAAILEASNH